MYKVGQKLKIGYYDGFGVNKTFVKVGSEVIKVSGNLITLILEFEDGERKMLHGYDFQVAEMERNTIIERTQNGKVIAKSKPGFKEGRPKKYTQKQLDNALKMLSVNGGDKSYNEVSELLGISKSTLIRENTRRKNSV